MKFKGIFFKKFIPHWKDIMLSFLKIEKFWRKCIQKALKISLSLPKKKKVAAPLPHPSLGHPSAKTT